MIDFTPDPVFFRILGIPIYWYGIAYAVGLAVVYWVVIRKTRLFVLRAAFPAAKLAIDEPVLRSIVDRWVFLDPAQ